MKVFAIFATTSLLFVNSVSAAPSVQDNRVEGENGSSLALAARYLGSCFDAEDMSTCFAVKGITTLNRAARSNNIELVNGISFKRCVSACDVRQQKYELKHKSKSCKGIYNIMYLYIRII